jgi:hypothetical protein
MDKHSKSGLWNLNPNRNQNYSGKRKQHQCAMNVIVVDMKTASGIKDTFVSVSVAITRNNQAGGKKGLTKKNLSS